MTPTAQRLRAILDSLDRVLGSGLDDLDGHARLLADLRAVRQLSLDMVDQDARLNALAENLDEAFYASLWVEDAGFVERAVSRRWSSLGLPVPTGGEAVLRRFVHPDDLTALAERDAQLRRGEASEQEYRIRGADGLERWVLDRSKPRATADGELHVDGILLDVTASRRARDELAEANATIGRLLSAIDDHLYTAELGDDGSYTEIFTGPGIDRLVGVPPGILEPAALVLAFNDAIHPDDQGLVDAFNDRLAEGVVAEVQYRIVGHDGHTRWVLDRARPRPRPSGADRTIYDGIVSDVTERVRAQAEQDALQRVATAVARGAPADEVFTLVANEVANLLDVETGHVARLDGPAFRFVGRSAGSLAGTPDLVPITGLSASAEVLRTGASARVAFTDDVEEPTGVRLRSVGYRSSVAAPIHVGGAVWGVIVAASSTEHLLADDGESRLERFADLVGLAIANADARARLADQAARDPLTSLPNHRTFQERLREETERAQRHERPLSLVLVDLDWFKQVNDAHGHPVGDKVLTEVGALLERHARAGELVARIGGEEFAWILPETDSAGALAAVERVRRALAAHTFAHGIRLTISAGVCDLAQAGDANELVRLADGALYWAKAQGRDACVRYTPAVVEVLSAAEHGEARARVQAMNGIRALARAVDAKDVSTREHSERVASLAEALAVATGWAPEAAAALRVAGLVHDVGKIGVPDAVLTKPGRLTAEEYELVKGHAALGASIVSDVLTRDQASWVRHHHERWDGKGYPQGLAGVWIPEGARLLALADAWDAMTSARPYHVPRSAEDALEECRRVAGRQFCPRAVEALARHLGAEPAIDAA